MAASKSGWRGGDEDCRLAPLWSPRSTGGRARLIAPLHTPGTAGSVHVRGEVPLHCCCTPAAGDTLGAGGRPPGRATGRSRGTINRAVGVIHDAPTQDPNGVLIRH